MTNKIISPILLAAGSSRRFGSDKLLHSFKYRDLNKPLILHTLASWLEVFELINVIVRADNYSLIKLLQSNEYKTRLNLILADDASNGMSASLIRGIQASKNADGWLIGLADMPFIASSVIKDLLNEMQAGATITMPIFNSRRGHPVGFNAGFLPQLLSLSGDKGAKAVIESYPDAVTLVASPDNGIWVDIDTTEDLK